MVQTTVTRHIPFTGVLRSVDYEELFSTPCMQIATSSADMDPTPQQALAVRIVAYSVTCAHLD